LFLCSVAVAADALSAQQRSDLTLLRSNDQTQYKASPDIIAAAQRIFTQLPFLGLPKSTVEERLGPPREKRTVQSREVYDYMYHDGEGGVHIQFEFDSAAQVTAIRRLPTQ